MRVGGFVNNLIGLFALLTLNLSVAQASGQLDAQNYDSVEAAFQAAGALEVSSLKEKQFSSGSCYYSAKPRESISAAMAYTQGQLAFVQEVPEGIDSFEKFASVYSSKFVELVIDPQSGDLMAEDTFSVLSLRQQGGLILAMYTADRMAGEIACVFGY